MERLRSAVVPALFLLVAACGDGDSMRRQLLSVDWQLQAFEQSSGEVIPVDDPSRYTVTFGGDGRVAARTDCNRCVGGYTTAGSSMTIGALACTRAACSPGSLADEYEQALATVSQFQVIGNELILVHAGGRLRFRAP